MRLPAVILLATFIQAGAPPSDSPASVVAEVATLAAAADNDGRFDALTTLLQSAKLSFTVEPVPLDRPVGDDPRSRGRNIVVSVGQGDRTILVGAHYDATYLDGGTLSRGAVDNAASAVLLVHTARTLSGERLGARVLFVWFDLEEQNLVGSQRYVASHTTDRPALMLNFDINAYGDTVLYAPTLTPPAPLLRTAVEAICSELAIDCLRFNQLPPSDDRPFARAGVPTASFATLPAGEAHHLWLTLNAGRNSALATTAPPPIMTMIHTPNDAVEKVDGTTVLNTARFATALIRRLSE